MPGQAQALVNKMLSELGKDEFEQSWKIITIFIGGNDLCTACDDTVCDKFHDELKFDLFFSHI